MSSTSNVQAITQVSDMGLGPVRAGEAAVAPPERTMTPADALRVLKERKLFILVSAVVLYGLVVAVTLAVWRWIPAYSATGIFQLRPPAKPLEAQEALIDPKVMETAVITEAHKIRREDILSEVLSFDEIKQTRYYQWYGGDFAKCLSEMRKDYLFVAAVPDTQLIEVTLVSRDAEESRLIVQRVMDVYERRYAAETRDVRQDQLTAVRNTKAEVDAKLRAKQQELADFRLKRDVGALESETEVLIRAITDMMYQVNAYDTRAADLQTQLDSIQGVDPRRLPVTPEDRVIVEADPILRLYRQQVESLDVEMAAAMATLSGRNSRQMKLLAARRAGYFEREVARREELLNDLRERKVDNLREELARVRSIQARLQDHLREQQSKQTDLDAARVAYQSLVKDEERLQKQLEDIGRTELEFQHLIAMGPRTPRLFKVQEPRKAVKPSRPNLPLWLGGGVALAILGALGLAFLREATDQALRTPIDVARHGRLSVLGCVPLLDDEQAEVEGIEQATRQAPYSLVAESFRQVRANLMFSGPSESQRVLLVTSPGPGNGKTSTAINLAVSLAQGHQKVLLIDCNFRRPSLRAAFPGTRPDGLSNILVGRARLDDLVTATDIPNLYVLTSGPMPPTPAELLGSVYMTELLREAKSKFERVLLDAPPVLLISDALVLATQVDGVLLVARAEENTKGELRRANEQLQKINAHVIGAVFNGARARSGGYYRRQYREFYDYTLDETVPPELPGVPPESAGTEPRS